MKKCCFLLLSSLLAMACGGKKSSGEKPKGDPAQMSPAAMKGPMGVTPPGRAVTPRPRRAAAPKPIPDAELRRLVADWLDAQNKGNFAAYSALYAAKIIGVKRAGKRTRRYDRKGWLRDRGRMFKKKMTVSADKLSIAALSSTAIVRFVQSWASGGFRDKGPKQLLVVKERGKLRIAREEMLASQVATRALRPLNRKPGSLMLVAPLARTGRFHILLKQSPDPRWAKPGHRHLVRDGLVVRDVDPTKLPAAIAGLRGQKVDVFGHGARACQVTIKDFALRAEVVPHFHAIETWEGRQESPRLSDPQIAAELWSLAGGDETDPGAAKGIWLVARVDKKAAACGAALYWARLSRHGAPTAWTALKDASLQTAALGRFKTLAGYVAAQKDFRKDGKRGSWHQYQGARPHMFAAKHPRTGTKYVYFGVIAGTGCGDFEASLWAIWEVQGKQWKLVTDPKGNDGYFVPFAAVDTDGDGRPELLGKQAVAAPGRDGAAIQWSVTLRYSPPFYDCGC